MAPTGTHPEHEILWDQAVVLTGGTRSVLWISKMPGIFFFFFLWFGLVFLVCFLVWLRD